MKLASKCRGIIGQLHELQAQVKKQSKHQHNNLVKQVSNNDASVDPTTEETESDDSLTNVLGSSSMAAVTKTKKETNPTTTTKEEASKSNTGESGPHEEAPSSPIAAARPPAASSMTFPLESPIPEQADPEVSDSESNAGESPEQHQDVVKAISPAKEEEEEDDDNPSTIDQSSQHQYETPRQNHVLGNSPIKTVDSSDFEIELEDDDFGGEDRDETLLPSFNPATSAQRVTLRQKDYNEGFPDDIIRPKKLAATMKEKHSLLSSIDAFEASFNTNFPDTFSPRDEPQKPEPVYDPFASSPMREEKSQNDEDIDARPEKQPVVSETLIPTLSTSNGENSSAVNTASTTSPHLTLSRSSSEHSSPRIRAEALLQSLGKDTTLSPVSNNSSPISTRSDPPGKISTSPKVSMSRKEYEKKSTALKSLKISLPTSSKSWEASPREADSISLRSTQKSPAFSSLQMSLSSSGNSLEPSPRDTESISPLNKVEISRLSSSKSFEVSPRDSEPIYPRRGSRHKRRHRTSRPEVSQENGSGDFDSVAAVSPQEWNEQPPAALGKSISKSASRGHSRRDYFEERANSVRERMKALQHQSSWKDNSEKISPKARSSPPSSFSETSYSPQRVPSLVIQPNSSYEEGSFEDQGDIPMITKSPVKK